MLLCWSVLLVVCGPMIIHPMSLLGSEDTTESFFFPFCHLPGIQRQSCPSVFAAVVLSRILHPFIHYSHLFITKGHVVYLLNVRKYVFSTHFVLWWHVLHSCTSVEHFCWGLAEKIWFCLIVFLANGESKTHDCNLFCAITAETCHISHGTGFSLYSMITFTITYYTLTTT